MYVYFNEKKFPHDFKNSLCILILFIFGFRVFLFFLGGVENSNGGGKNSLAPQKMFAQYNQFQLITGRGLSEVGNLVDGSKNPLARPKAGYERKKLSLANPDNTLVMPTIAIHFF